MVCQAGLLLGIAVVTPDAVGDFGEVSDPGRGDDVNFLGEFMVIHPGLTLHFEPTTGFEQVHQSAKEAVHPRVVELTGDGAFDWHFRSGGVPEVVVTLNLFLHIPQGILSPSFIKFVHRDEVGKVQHINFFELGCGPVFRRHNIERNIAVINDFGIALADAGGF